jgi:hypothetical protein
MVHSLANLALSLSSRSLLRVASSYSYSLHLICLHAAKSILSMETTAWLAILVSAAPALAVQGLSGFAGTKRGDWREIKPIKHHNTPLPDDNESSGQLSSSSLSEPASDPATTESIWGSRFIAALQMIAEDKPSSSFSYAPVASAMSDPSPEVAPTTMISVITEYASAAPTAVHLAEKTVTIYTTIFKAICTKTDKWTKDGTVFSSSYEIVTTSSIIDSYNPNSPTAAPETIPSSPSELSILIPDSPNEHIHASGDSIVTSTLTSTIKTTATETDPHTVQPSAGSDASRANPSNYGNIPLTHPTKSSPPTFVDLSSSAVAEHEPTHRASSTSAKPHYFPISACHRRPSSAGALSVPSEPHTQESPAVSVAPSSPSAPAHESELRGPINTPWHSKVVHEVPSVHPAALSIAPSGPFVSSEQPSYVVSVPIEGSAFVEYTLVTSTWVSEIVTQFTSVYTTALPQTSTWNFKKSNITSTRTYLANMTTTSVGTSTIFDTHTTVKSVVTRFPSPLRDDLPARQDPSDRCCQHCNSVDLQVLYRWPQVHGHLR